LEVRNQEKAGIDKRRHGQSGRDLFRNPAQAPTRMTLRLNGKNSGLRDFHPSKLAELH
jgi:hypothetical protein